MLPTTFAEAVRKRVITPLLPKAFSGAHSTNLAHLSAIKAFITASITLVSLVATLVATTVLYDLENRTARLVHCRRRNLTVIFTLRRTRELLPTTLRPLGPATYPVPVHGKRRNTTQHG